MGHSHHTYGYREQRKQLDHCEGQLLCHLQMQLQVSLVACQPSFLSMFYPRHSCAE